MADSIDQTIRDGGIEARRRTARRATALTAPGALQSREGLTFSNGQRVLDTVTGKEGTIRRGTNQLTLTKPA